MKPPDKKQLAPLVLEQLLNNKTTDLDELLHKERKEHDAFYSHPSAYEDWTGQIAFDIASYERRLAWPWQANFDLYSTENALLFRALKKAGLLDVEGPILEYGCGRGDLSCYISLKYDKRSVYGFDLSSEGIRFGRRLVQAAGLDSRVVLEEMNGMNLRYPDNFFELAVGFGVLHHIAKYPGTASELERVMKPGATLIFVEPLGNAFWQTIRRTTMGSTEYGDVNLTSRIIRDWATPFDHVGIQGMNLLFMLKRALFVRQEGPNGVISKRRRFNGASWMLARGVLSGAFLLDELVVNHSPIGNWLGGMSLITLRKKSAGPS